MKVGARACCRRRAVVAVARARLEANPRRARVARPVVWQAVEPFDGYAAAEAPALRLVCGEQPEMPRSAAASCSSGAACSVRAAAALARSDNHGARVERREKLGGVAAAGWEQWRGSGEQRGGGDGMGATFTAFDGTRSFCRPIQYSEGLCKLTSVVKTTRADILTPRCYPTV